MEHPIRVWLAATNPAITVTELADRIGISRIHLGRLMRAQGNFNTEIFEKLEKATAGGLKAVDLFAYYQTQRTKKPRRSPSAMAEAG